MKCFLVRLNCLLDFFLWLWEKWKKEKKTVNDNWFFKEFFTSFLLFYFKTSVLFFPHTFIVSLTRFLTIRHKFFFSHSLQIKTLKSLKSKNYQFQFSINISDERENVLLCFSFVCNSKIVWKIRKTDKQICLTLELINSICCFSEMYKTLFFKNSPVRIFLSN